MSPIVSILLHAVREVLLHVVLLHIHHIMPVLALFLSSSVGASCVSPSLGAERDESIKALPPVGSLWSLRLGLTMQVLALW